ncbi:MAG: hypothetical protein IJ901_09990 [Bacteroidaceae bacterium]|nr:hypothetical protein [Bacteroidaceae bacterium]
MTHLRTLLITLLCALAGTAQAETITRTYLFSGHMEGSTCEGYFYEETTPGTHYSSSPATWTYNFTSRLNFTLADGISLTLASSTSQISAQSNVLGGEGNVTLTLNGGSTYYIWHVTVYGKNGNLLFDETNRDDTDAENTRVFSWGPIDASSNGIAVGKIVITYSEQDIYLIDESSTTISGVDDVYDYTGSQISPEPEVVMGGTTLTENVHYTVSYADNVAVGRATLVVTGISPYHGSISQTYFISDGTTETEWAAGNTYSYSVDETITGSISVTGTGNVTLTIAEGVTLTASKGITIPDGATLTIMGPGTLEVYGTHGTTVSTFGGDGTQGGAGISGTCTAADHIIQDSSDNTTWYNLASGSTSNKQYVRVIETTHLTLYDNADNTAAIQSAAGDGISYTVTLSGRTFYKDGAWNTICLPFDVTLANSPLASDGVDVRELTGSSFDSSTGTLTLSFTEGWLVSITSLGVIMECSNITTIEAGKPYLIRWGTPEVHPSSDLVDPVFTNVAIKSGTTNTVTDYVDFIGTFPPTTLTGGNTSVLYLASDNKLYYPSADVNIKSHRAYFQLKGIAAGDSEQGNAKIREFQLIFGENTNSLTPIPSSTREKQDDAWYDLYGRKMVNGQLPCGIYIHNGKKVVIK